MGKSKWKLKNFSKHTWKIIVFVKVIKYVKIPVHIRKLSTLIRRSPLYNRSGTIPFCYTGHGFLGYSQGKKIVIQSPILSWGYKFGELYLTRKPYYFPQKERKKKR